MIFKHNKNISRNFIAYLICILFAIGCGGGGGSAPPQANLFFLPSCVVHLDGLDGLFLPCLCFWQLPFLLAFDGDLHCADFVGEGSARRSFTRTASFTTGVLRLVDGKKFGHTRRFGIMLQRQRQFRR